ncbi:hypothetical protein GCM10022237_23970 [Nocardioides ginsengisoli]|uniref:CbtB-domain containing protein n=1 Tax=Nocardioides ginsengisoli TaxID=363868 RepID=A0ABW3W4G6_9ACTN
MNIESTPLAHRPTPSAVPLWASALAAVALLAVFLILQGNDSLLSAEMGSWLHEVTHDGRHALGVPCD